RGPPPEVWLAPPVGYTSARGREVRHGVQIHRRRRHRRRHHPVRAAEQRPDRHTLPDLAARRGPAGGHHARLGRPGRRARGRAAPRRALAAPLAPARARVTARRGRDGHRRAGPRPDARRSERWLTSGAISSGPPSATRTLMHLLPRTLAALLILVVGWLAANFLGQAVLIAAVNAGLPEAGLLARAARWLVLLFAFATALTEVGIGRDTVVIAFGIL